MRMFPESIVPSADGSAGRGRRDIPETPEPADGVSYISAVPTDTLAKMIDQ